MYLAIWLGLLPDDGPRPAATHPGIGRVAAVATGAWLPGAGSARPAKPRAPGARSGL